MLLIDVVGLEVNFTIDMSETKMFKLKKYYGLFYQNNYCLLGILTTGNFKEKIISCELCVFYICVVFSLIIHHKIFTPTNPT